MMWGYSGFGGGWGMGIGMLLFWFLIIFAVVLLARAAFGTRSWGGCGADFMPRGRAAIDILRERYARGEIEKTEFEEKLRDLERAGSSRR